jgi:hypothetical protein
MWGGALMGPAHHLYCILLLLCSTTYAISSPLELVQGLLLGVLLPPLPGPRQPRLQCVQLVVCSASAGAGDGAGATRHNSSLKAERCIKWQLRKLVHRGHCMRANCCGD